MRILGIDPGVALTGYGLIDYEDDSRIKVVEYGKIETNNNMKKSLRLYQIHNELSMIISLYKPDTIAIEELFFNKNSKTVISVGEARGVIILTCIQNGLNVYEYTPLQVKQAITGYGKADKLQIQNMIKMLLKLDEIPKPDDVADALAVAVCHAFYKSSCLYQEDDI